MLDEQVYTNYLLKKKKNEKTINEHIAILKNFITFVDDSQSVNEYVDRFLKTWGATETHKRIEVLSDYIKYIKKEESDSNLIELSEAINAALMKLYENKAKNSAAYWKSHIKLIPSGVKIAEKHLGEVTNEGFVRAFRDMQQVIISIYDDIIVSPFLWGYPDYNTTDGYYDRVNDFLYAFVFNGTYDKGVLTVNMKGFLSDKRIKSHKKTEQMISGFVDMGFAIDGFNKKSASFNVAYLDNPQIVYVMNEYINEIDKNEQSWKLGIPKRSFSYRFIEDPNMQKYETVFLAELDLHSEKLREIQYWLYDEAAKFGFKIDTAQIGGIQYKKGSKRLIMVGEEMQGGFPIIKSRIIFRDVFNNEKDRMKKLCRRFPDTFKSNCSFCGGSPVNKSTDGKCMMRICYDIDGKPHHNCAYISFNFNNLDLDDVKELLEMFIIENKIKK